jgi:hypothetical protein
MNNNLDKTSFLLQFYSILLLLKDFNNSDLMQELQNQDSNYLQKIIEQNNEILQILKERSEINGRQSNKENK